MSACSTSAGTGRAPPLPLTPSRTAGGFSTGVIQSDVGAGSSADARRVKTTNGKAIDKNANLMARHISDRRAFVIANRFIVI